MVALFTKYTEEEIRFKCYKIWGEEEDGCYYEMADFIEVEIHSDRIDIKISSEYFPPHFSYIKLMKLADLFGTKNINDDEKFSHDGCETCNYGSEYGFILTVRP